MKVYQIGRQESGQVLVQMSIALLVILGFASLAVDVGNVYSERRRMQNAADAAALAGARQLCLGNTEAAAIAEAERYLVENGVNQADIQPGDITVTGGLQVAVIARENANMFLADVIGVTDVDVAATATAACGAATSACGMWPVTFDVNQWNEINPEDATSCNPEQFVVWNDENDDITCLLPDPNNLGELLELENICNCYDCDLDNDGEDDFTVITNLARGWLDFSGAVTEIYTDNCSTSGCGASELACHIRNNVGVRMDLPSCVAGTRGVRASIKDDVESRVGDVVGIPLFGGTNCTVAGGNNCQGTEASSYNIVKVGCVTVRGWEQNFTLNPIIVGDLINKKIKGKVIMADVHCDGCFSSCGTTDGTPPEPWEMRAVSLVQ